MQLRLVRPAAVLGVLAVVLATVVLGPAAAGANPAISLSPSTGLHDGQTVTVSGTGFAKSADVYIVECSVGASAIGQCAFTLTNLNTVVMAKTDSSGNLHSPSPALKTTFKGIDCTKTPCEIAAHVGTQATLTATNTATHPISFGTVSQPGSGQPTSPTQTTPGSVSVTGPAGVVTPGATSATASSSSASGPTSAGATAASGAPVSATVVSGSSPSATNPVTTAPNAAVAASGTKKADNGARYLAVLIAAIVGVLFVAGMAASGRRARG